MVVQVCIYIPKLIKSFFGRLLGVSAFRAMNILERGLLSSRANFHLKILLIRIYLEAGVTVGANFAYSMLDCKHIQLDSLGHLYAPLLAPLGYLSQASYCLDHAAKFFIANYKDVCKSTLFTVVLPI